MQDTIERMQGRWLSIILFILLAFSQTNTQANPKRSSSTTNSFHEFIQQVRHDATQMGVSSATLDRYLSPLRAPAPIRQHLHYRQTHQAEQIWTFADYLRHTLSHTLIETGRQHYHTHHALLARITQQYGVPGHYLIAIWGMESHFGRNIGHDPLIQSLAILAYQHHRSTFFRKQLIDALQILDQPHVLPETDRSAWDGGMGQIQFEPSTYLTYAVDFNHDGVKDIWRNLDDSLASIANFLKENGWQPHQTWGLVVKLPATLPLKGQALKQAYRLSQWQHWGVRQPHGHDLPHSHTPARLIQLPGLSSKALLVFHNFDVLMRWNRSIDEAATIGLFADALLSHQDPNDSLFQYNSGIISQP